MATQVGLDGKALEVGRTDLTPENVPEAMSAETQLENQSGTGVNDAQVVGQETPGLFATTNIAPASAGATDGPKAPFSLDQLSIDGLDANSFDGGDLKIKVPLQKGVWPFPVGKNGQDLNVKVPDGTTLEISAKMVPRADGPHFESMGIHFSKGVTVQNPAVLMGKEQVRNVTLRKVDVDAAGELTLDGEAEAKIGFFWKEVSLSGFLVSLVDLPTFNTSAAALLRGEVLKGKEKIDTSKAKGASQGLDIAKLAESLGGMTDKAEFDVSIRAKAGWVEVGSEQVKLRANNAPLVSTLSLAGDLDLNQSGKFSASARGELDTGLVDASVEVKSEGQVDNGISGSLSTKMNVSPDTEAGVLRVTTNGDEASKSSGATVHIQVDPEFLAAIINDTMVKHQGDTVTVDSGAAVVALLVRSGVINVESAEDMDLSLTANGMVSADMSFELGENVNITSQGIKLELSAPDSKLETDRISVALGEGSSISGEVSKVAVEDGKLVLGDATIDYSLTLPEASLEGTDSDFAAVNSSVSGSATLALGSEPRAETNVEFVFNPAPDAPDNELYGEGKRTIVITKDGVEVSESAAA